MVTQKNIGSGIYDLWLYDVLTRQYVNSSQFTRNHPPILGPHRRVGDMGASLPLRHGLRIDALALGQRSYARLTMLYCSTERRRPFPPSSSRCAYARGTIVRRLRGAIPRASEVEERGPVVYDSPARRQGLPRRTGISVGGLIIAEVLPREGTILALGSVEDRDVRRDRLLLDQPVEHRCRAVGRVAGEPLRFDQPGELRVRPPSASIRLASTAKPSPPTRPASIHDATTRSNTRRKMSLSRKRSFRAREKAAWCGMVSSRPRSQNHR